MSDNLITILLAVPLLALSIAAHEMMHAFVSDKLGDDTARHLGRISLNPLRHIDPLTTVALPLFMLLMGLPPIGAAKPVMFNPYKIKYEEFGVAIVAVAGPLTNLLLALVFGGIISLAGKGGLVEAIATLGLYINVGFFVFNMIPYPPLDGSRILYAFSPDPIQRVMRSIESFGFMGIVFFIFVIFPFIQPLTSHVNEFLISIFN